MTQLLRTRIEQAGYPPRITVGDELIHASIVLPAFYEQRLFRPAWLTPGRPMASAQDLIQSIRGAHGEGLNPRDYHLAELEALMRRVASGESTAALEADLDLLLTDAFLIYGAHLLSGRVDPETLDPEWIAARRDRDLGKVLVEALEWGGVSEALAALLPTHPGYGMLKGGLSRYRVLAAAGGWPTIPGEESIRPGDTGERVALLRQRLTVTGDHRPELDAAPELFGDSLERSVRRFQIRHGLEADGIVGPRTLEALNVTAEERARQIEINLERWRWLPQDLGSRYVLVNIPEFRLWVAEQGRRMLEMRVVVGRFYRRTPVFSDTMKYLVLSPFWEIPTNIAVQDILPQVRRDPGYLAQQRIRVYSGWGGEREEIDPMAIDWLRVAAVGFPYRFRQDPGALNALGGVKFMFPNKFNVYLHDSPARELFARSERDFSSGCIRVEKAVELAEYLLQESPGWDRESILAAIARNEEQMVPLSRPIAVHLLYWTAWVDEKGNVEFRRDLYQRDRNLDEALRFPPPKAESAAAAAPRASGGS